MSDFIQYVLYELNNILILLALAGVLAAGVIACAYLIFRKRHKGERNSLGGGSRCICCWRGIYLSSYPQPFCAGQAASAENTICISSGRGWRHGITFL